MFISLFSGSSVVVRPPEFAHGLPDSAPALRRVDLLIPDGARLCPLTGGRSTHGPCRDHSRLGYENPAADGYLIRDGDEPDWRQVCLESWIPTGGHYGFCDWKKMIGVEIRLGCEQVEPLQSMPAAVKDDLAEGFPRSELDRDPEWDG